MNMVFSHEVLIFSLSGGLLIGLSAVLMFAGIGRITGISGIVYQSINNLTDSNSLWRILFLLGLILGTLSSHWIIGFEVPAVSDKGWLMAVVAGFVVGFGTRLGSGCTSGHGICGLSRFSFRSLVATLTFMASGFVTVFIVNHIL